MTDWSVIVNDMVADGVSQRRDAKAAEAGCEDFA
jgi:hypothetical protein